MLKLSVIERAVDNYCRTVQNCAEHFGVQLSPARTFIEPFYLSRRIQSAPKGTKDEKREIIKSERTRGIAQSVAYAFGAGLIYLITR